MSIYLTQRFTDTEGKAIQVKIEQIAGSMMPGNTIYLAMVHANVDGEPIPLEIPIDGVNDIHEAFAKFHETVKAKGQQYANEFMRKMRDQMRSQMIARPR